MELIHFVRANASVFSCSYVDMPEIDPSVVSYKLNINPCQQPVWKKWRSYNVKRYEAIKVEVDKLLDIKSIRSVNYPQWGANVVMVKKVIAVGKPTK